MYIGTVTRYSSQDESEKVIRKIRTKLALIIERAFSKLLWRICGR